jgi:hypothetical protein
VTHPLIKDGSTAAKQRFWRANVGYSPDHRSTALLQTLPSDAAFQMKHFETPANTDTGIEIFEKVFVSLVTDIINVLVRDETRSSVCSLVCSSRRRVASCICPTLLLPDVPVYAQLEHEAAKGSVSLASAFAAASMPLDGLANAALIPILSRAQQLLLVCSCGHARHFIDSIMPQDMRRFTENSRRVLLLQLFSFPMLSRFENAASKVRMKRLTGGSMLAGRQLQPSDAAWQRVSSRATCACCHVTFGLLFNRHHHCRFISRSRYSVAPDVVTACLPQVLRAFDVR